MKVVWRNIAFSFGGLRKLTAQADSFEPLFREGLASASARLGDPTDSATPGSSASWVVGKPGEEPDLLVVIAGDDDSEINAEIDSFLKEAEKAGIGCPFFDIGHDLAYYNDGKTIRFPSGREHFGFEDGISQPGVRGRLSEAVDDFLTPRVLLEVNHDSSLPQFSAPGQPLICPGEFVLGYPRQHESLGRRPATPWPLGPKPFAPAANVVGPYWAKNGSFLVYRRLRQDVPAFNRFLKLEASRLASIPEFKKFTDEQLGAMLVGRWRSGAPMLRTPTDDAPDLGNTTGANNAFGFAANTDPDDGFPTAQADPLGRICPQANHIRKVNPRDLGTDQGGPNATLTHRILRRGLPYGPPLPAGATDDPTQRERGLLFLAYQASILNQFEFLTASWMNDRAKPTPQFAPLSGAGFDMIVGQNPDPRDRTRSCLLTRGNTAQQISTNLQWVIPTGGGYFFAPSRSAISDVLSES